MITAIRFTAPWCRPCKSFAPVFDEFMSEIEGVNSHVVDIDSRPEVAELYGVTTIPTVVFEDDGTEIARVVGPKPKSALKAALNT